MPYFVVAALLFVLLESAFPAVRPKALFRRGFRTDLLYLAIGKRTEKVLPVSSRLWIGSSALSICRKAKAREGSASTTRLA